MKKFELKQTSGLNSKAVKFKYLESEDFIADLVESGKELREVKLWLGKDGSLYVVPNEPFEKEWKGEWREDKSIGEN